MKACLIGKTLKHSFSQQIHNKLGCDYTLTEVAEESLAAFAAQKLCYNVTIPYKEKIIPLLDKLDVSACLVGAVNTVAQVDGQSIGYNTDIDGLFWLFQNAGVQLHGKKVTILGDGGTSKTTQALCKREGATATVVGISGRWNYSNYGELADTQILVNATPVGMFPNTGERLVDLAKFPNLQFVADVVYNPLKTQLLLDAEALGIPCADGLGMLVVQAVFAEQIWQGKTFTQHIPRILAEVRQNVQNVVLVGMPSCGKSTVGKLVADMLNKPFVDLDEQIVLAEQMSIPQIFAQHGEAYFREVEARLARQYGNQSGIVLATGGGTPLRQHNKDALRQNGFVVWLQRDLSQLSTDGRPVSQAVGNATLLQQRREHYLAVSDVAVSNDASAEDAARTIVQLFKQN